MALTIVSSFIPNLFEGLSVSAVTLTATGFNPLNTLEWTRDLIDEDLIGRPLPEGLELTLDGEITGTPQDISNPGPSGSSITATAGTYILTLNSLTNPDLFPGARLRVANLTDYVVSSFSSSGSVYTVQVNTIVPTGGHTAASYTISPAGNAKSFPVIIRVTEKSGSTVVATVKKDFVITVLKVNNTETLYTYLSLNTDFDGCIPVATFKKLVDQVPAEQKASLVSLAQGTQVTFNRETQTHERLVVLPALSTNDDSYLYVG